MTEMQTGQMLIDLDESDGEITSTTPLPSETIIETAERVSKKPKGRSHNAKTTKTEVGDSVDRLGAEVPNDEAEAIGEETEESSSEKSPAFQITDDWNPDNIGTPPKGKTNPYFHGVYAHCSLTDKTILVPYKEIQWISRQLLVDDIHLANPTVIDAVYRIYGSFYQVVARVTEADFNQLLQHPLMKKVDVRYNYISDHIIPRRNYNFNHANLPTAEEVAKKDKEINGWQWKMVPDHEKRNKTKPATLDDETVEEIEVSPEVEPELELGDVEDEQPDISL